MSFVSLKRATGAVRYDIKKGVADNTAMKATVHDITRRSFLKTCSAAAASTGLPLWFLERQADAAFKAKPLSANDRPGVALVGCGGMGRGDAGNASRFGEIIAVCDVDQKHVEDAAKQFTKDGKVPSKYSDLRKLMERDDIHVIINGTPDHWHTLVNFGGHEGRQRRVCRETAHPHH